MLLQLYLYARIGISHAVFKKVDNEWKNNTIPFAQNLIIGENIKTWKPAKYAILTFAHLMNSFLFVFILSNNFGKEDIILCRFNDQSKHRQKSFFDRKGPRFFMSSI